MKNKNYILLISLITFISAVLSVQLTRQQFLNQSSTTNPFNNIPKLQELKIPILMYHYVEINKNKKDFLRDRQNVPPHIFEQQIVTLKKAGYKFITPKDLPNLMSQGKVEEDKYVILTFDDGYRDFYTDVYPILRKHNVSAINYIIYNLVGGNNYMTDYMLQEIVNWGKIEIGAHTLTHSSLVKISLQDAEKEIKQSKENLETKYGTEIHSFAYPYGFYNEKIVNIVKKSGYKSAVTVEMGNVANANNIYTLKRLRPGHLVGAELLEYIRKDFN